MIAVLKNSISNYTFRYLVAKSNQSNDIIKLINRSWKIIEISKSIQVE